MPFLHAPTRLMQANWNIFSSNCQIGWITSHLRGSSLELLSAGLPHSNSHPWGEFLEVPSVDLPLQVSTHRVPHPRVPIHGFPPSKPHPRVSSPRASAVPRPKTVAGRQSEGGRGRSRGIYGCKHAPRTGGLENHKRGPCCCSCCTQQHWQQPP